MKIIVILLVGIATLYGDSEKNFTVIADLANVRQRPDINSRIVAKLPIGYSVSVTDSSKEWYRSNYGWMHSATISREEKFKADYSGRVRYFLDLKNLANYSTLQDSIRWLERCHAHKLHTNPYYRLGDRKYVAQVTELLRNGYLRTGDTLRAEALMQPKVIHLGDIFGGVRYIGHIDDAGDFTPQTWHIRLNKEYWRYSEEHWEQSESEGSDPLDYQVYGYPHPDWINRNYPQSMRNWGKFIEELKVSLMGLCWYSLVEEEPKIYIASNFATPDKLLQINHVCHVEVDTFGALYLDTATTQRGSVYATHPVRFIKTRGITTPEDFQRIQKCIYILRGNNFTEGGIGRIHALFLPDGGLDLTIDAQPANRTRYSYHNDLLRGIFSPADSLLWPTEYNVSGNDEDETYYKEFYVYHRESNYSDWLNVEEIFMGNASRHYDWFTVDGLEQYSFLLIPYSTFYRHEKGGVSRGRILIRLGPEGIKTWKIGEVSFG